MSSGHVSPHPLVPSSAEETVRGLLVVAVLLLVLALIASAAQATIVTASASSFTGDPLTVDLVIDDESDPGNLVITLEIADGGPTGDLRGFFAQIGDESLLAGLSVTGEYVTDDRIAANRIRDLGRGANLNGGGSPCPCDIAVEFGNPGIGKEDLQAVMFVLSHSTETLTTSLFDGQTFGVRVTSVGDWDGCREGSSKLVGVVPEPSTALLVGIGLAGLGVAGRRSRPARV